MPWEGVFGSKLCGMCLGKGGYALGGVQYHHRQGPDCTQATVALGIEP